MLRSWSSRVALALLATAFAGSAYLLQNQAVAAPRATATFAGGCFWCMEGPFEKLKGVSAVVWGFTGGQK